MSKHLIILLLAVFVINFSKAQKTEIAVSDTKQNFDTNYIACFDDLLSVRVYGISKFNKFELYYDKDKKSDSLISYSPNELLNLGFGFNYKWMSFAMAFNFRFINKDNDIYGETQKFDIQANMYKRKLTIDAYYQDYKGYYIDNPQDFLVSWNDTLPFPQRQDIKTTAVGASCIYTFNHEKFSYRSSFIQNEWQKKSAGSLLLGNYLSYYRILADSSIVPGELKDSIDPTNNIKGAEFANLGISCGYAYTVVIRQHFFITLSMASGISLQYFNTEAEDKEYNSTKPLKLSSNIQTRIATGYNSRKFYTGICFVSNNFEINREDASKLNYEIGNVKFFYGRRFGIRKKVTIQ